MQRRAPDRHELERIITKITGRAPDSENTITDFENALASHNIDNPRSKSKIVINNYEIEICGNALKISDWKNFEYYIDHKGCFRAYPDASIRERMWEENMRQSGWERFSGLSASKCEDDAKIYSLRTYGSMSDKGDIMLSFPCKNPDGAKHFLWITAASVCDHTTIAENLISSVLKTRSIMPGTQKSAIRVSELRVQKFIKEEQKKRGVDLVYKIGISSSWRSGCVLFETYDNLLRPQRQKIEIDLERCEDNIIKIKYDSKEDIERVLNTYKDRKKQVDKGGLVITSLAKNIITKFSVEKPRPYKTLGKDLDIEERLSVRNGVIGAKIMITNSVKNLKIKITNNMIEMPSDMIPESIKTIMVGSAIRSLVDYEGLGDDMIITSYKLEGRKIKVRFSDTKTPWTV